MLRPSNTWTRLDCNIACHMSTSQSLWISNHKAQYQSNDKAHHSWVCEEKNCSSDLSVCFFASIFVSNFHSYQPLPPPIFANKRVLWGWQRPGNEIKLAIQQAIIGVSRNESQQHVIFLCRLQHHSSFQFLFPFHFYFLLFHTLLIKPVTHVYAYTKHSEN